jgi:hypothetical protein
MFVEHVLSLRRSIFMMYCLVLFVEPLAFHRIESPDENATPITNHLLTNLGSESNYLGGVDIICLSCG